MPRHIAFALSLAGLVTLPAQAQAKLEVKPDRQNVVASRLMGDWDADAALTTRLGGQALAGASNGTDPRAGGRVTFKSDPAVAGQIPPEFVERIQRAMPDFRVYMAGTMTLGGLEYPFILTALAGNPAVMFFRERAGNRFGDGESFLLALTPAKEPMNDLLFIGGDFNNQPFSAFRRAGTSGTDGASTSDSARR